MSQTIASLSRKIGTAGDLQSVVRTMKAVAASSIGQFESAVLALDDYHRAVQLGLVACLREMASPLVPAPAPRRENGPIAAVVFGSDLGLVGQFNDVMASFVVTTLADLPAQKTVWTVGERIRSRLRQTDLGLDKSFMLPGSIGAITALVGQILVALETLREQGAINQVYVFHNSPHAGAIYRPVCQRLLPLDQVWRRQLTAMAWPTQNLPEVMGGGAASLRAFVREYLFVSLFRACAESLASENASRLVAMQRAEKNIDELLEALRRSFHRLRQSGIDEELFDLVSGFEVQPRGRNILNNCSGPTEK
ncbi:MAG: F0F1 ATP synthase subunit gamma [Rhodoferax sp.]|uniref:F0F1 ATP synthase subunit gamma n=1 Tax=Rhodoferax sp. TaxID=50421 RepID=UPI002732D1A6|nr:F0F1 ATP synthase subunit gamma [Rhodoferax sp.]MDP2679518.1 F0F1 ATP synthase subunit gamma [Rhodoferax sp.]